MPYVVRTAHGVYHCDTMAEARCVESGLRRNPSATSGLKLHQSERILGHRVRLVDRDHVVIDGIRHTRAEADALLGNT